MAPSRQIRYRHEPLGTSNRSLIRGASLVIVALLLGGLIVFGLYHYFGDRSAGGSAHSQHSIRKKQIVPSFLEAQKEKLHSYGWVNKEKQIIHVPIEFAMKWLVKKENSQGKDASLP